MGAPNQQRRPVALSDRGLGKAPLPETDIALDAKSLDTGADTMLANFGAGFRDLADKVGSLADRAAKREGEEEGQRAGLDPEFRPSRLGTIRADAYDQAALDVQKGQLVGRFGEDLQQAAHDNRGSPSALDQALQARRRAWLDRSDPSLHADIERIYSHSRLTSMREAARLQDANAIEGLRASTQDELNTRLRDLGQRAYSLGLDPAADRVIETELNELRQRLGVRGPQGERVIDAQRAEVLLENAMESVARGRMLGAFSRLPSIEAKEEFLRQLATDFGAGQGVAANFDLPRFERLQNALEADLRQARAEANVGNRGLAQEVRDALHNARQGVPMGEDQRAALEARVAASNRPELRELLGRVAPMIEMHRNLSRASLAELEQFQVVERERLRAGGDRAELDRLEMVEGILNAARANLERDPVAWAERTGLVRSTPIDTTSAETLTATLRLRMPAAEEIGEHHRVPVKYFRESERRALNAAMSEGGDRMIGVMAAIQAAAGTPERATAVLRELFNHNAPVSATIGALANAGAPEATIRDAAYGIQMRRQADYKPATPPPSDTSALVTEVYGATFGSMETARRATVDVANLLYEVRARKAGIGTFNSDMYRQALRDAVGERSDGRERYGGIVNQGWWNKNPIIIPPDMKQSKWQQTLDAIRPEDFIDPFGTDLRPRQADGTSIPMSTIRQGTLVPAGGGFRYWVAMGDPASNGQERFLMSQPGAGERGRFVVDLEQLSPALRRRRPDLFFGAQTSGSTGVLRAVTDAPERSITPQGFGARVTGAITVNGNSYRFATGGSGRGSIPFGEYTIGRFTSGDQRAAEGYSYRHDAFELNNAIDDTPGTANRPSRDGLLIHSANNGITAGCIGIQGDFARFQQDLRAELARSGGQRVKIRLGPNATASR